MAAAAPYFAIAAAVATVAKTASDLSQGTPKASGGQSSTPTQATATKDSNSSDIQANILKQEQARKAGGSGASDSILTGGLGALGKPDTAGGASTLLGL